jgi:hypothetical protein
MAKKQQVDPVTHETELLVSELASDRQGALAPFGEVTYPLPASSLPYQHPRPADRPHLVGLPPAEDEPAEH